MAVTLPHPTHLDVLDDNANSIASSNIKNTDFHVRDTIPKGFPDYVSAKMAWSGLNMTDEREYVYHLTNEEKEEIDSALRFFKGLGLDGDLVNSDNFPLPTLQQALKDLASEIHDGKGFFILRGIEQERYSTEDITIIFLGIQTYIADRRGRQDEAGNIIVHVIHDPYNSSTPSRSAHLRHSQASISFHTDGMGSVTAFQTRSPPLRGGECIISSIYTIYNVLVATRPDIIRTLARSDWPFVKPYYHQRPILFSLNSKLIINFAIESLIGTALFPRPIGVPDCTSEQLEALEVIQEIAEANALRFATQKGDLHFVNNLAILHRRDLFVDETGKRRHLARMWLRNEDKEWELPDVLSADWDTAFGEEGDRAWNIEPMPEAFFPLRKYPN